MKTPFEINHMVESNWNALVKFGLVDFTLEFQISGINLKVIELNLFFAINK